MYKKYGILKLLVSFTSN